ncbi:MAG: peroxiredoxin [Frankiales bacterium]|nr:peroxiredoxin [Frankiales bacterium]
MTASTMAAQIVDFRQAMERQVPAEICGVFTTEQADLDDAGTPANLTAAGQPMRALVEPGLALVALSPQRPAGSLDVQGKNAPTYALLSDPGNQIADQLGILTARSEAADILAAVSGLA